MEKNNGMNSIVRKINNGFVWQKLKVFIFFDLLIIVSAVFILGNIFINETPNMTRQLWDITHERLSFSGTNYKDLAVILKNDYGRSFTYILYDYLHWFIWPVIILKIYEILSFFDAFNYATIVRRKLKPLNDLAVQAQQVSTVAMDGSIEDLEAAISNYKVDGSYSKIHTNNEDLHSIEVAINNLILRMKEAQKQQNRFVSDASHELRTPISVIQGYVNMLDRWGKEDESVLEESIEALKNESEHMTELIEQLLFLARGDSGRNTLKFVDADLNKLMTEVWEESVMIDEKHVYEFVPQNEGKPIMINCDYAMLKQSARILIQNAAKYSSPGDAIKLRTGINEEGKAFYSVQDEGIGMQQADVVHIFERFYRSDSARNSETGGSGLGLSIAKWIVDAHGGVIEVLSRKDFGTRFTVVLK